MDRKVIDQAAAQAGIAPILLTPTVNSRRSLKTPSAGCWTPWAEARHRRSLR
jgi:hypothetical protein